MWSFAAGVIPVLRSNQRRTKLHDAVRIRPDANCKDAFCTHFLTFFDDDMRGAVLVPEQPNPPAHDADDDDYKDYHARKAEYAEAQAKAQALERMRFTAVNSAARVVILDYPEHEKLLGLMISLWARFGVANDDLIKETMTVVRKTETEAAPKDKPYVLICPSSVSCPSPVPFPCHGLRSLLVYALTPQRRQTDGKGTAAGAGQSFGTCMLHVLLSERMLLRC